MSTDIQQFKNELGIETKVVRFGIGSGETAYQITQTHKDKIGYVQLTIQDLVKISTAIAEKEIEELK